MRHRLMTPTAYPAVGVPTAHPHRAVDNYYTPFKSNVFQTIKNRHILLHHFLGQNESLKCTRWLLYFC